MAVICIVWFRVFTHILVFLIQFVKMGLCAVGKAVELNKQRSPKQLSQAPSGIPEQPDSPASNSGRIRGNQLSDGSDTSAHVLPSTSSPAQSSPIGQASDTSGQDSDASKKTVSLRDLE